MSTNMKVFKTSKDTFTIPKEEFNTYSRYFLNGEEISLPTQPVLISAKDTLESQATYSNKINHYTKKTSEGEVTMSVEEYESYPTWLDPEDGSTEHLQRVLENKIKVAGFIPVKETPIRKKVEFEIVGTLRKTGSDYITTYLQLGAFEKKEVPYVVNVQAVLRSEYLRLSKEWSKYASFQILKRSKTMQYLKVGGKYVFSDNWMFKGSNPATFTSLKAAQAEEARLREMVRNMVSGFVFNNTNPPKPVIRTLIGKLELIKSLEGDSQKEALDKVLDYLKDYEGRKI